MPKGHPKEATLVGRWAIFTSPMEPGHRQICRIKREGIGAWGELVEIRLAGRYKTGRRIVHPSHLSLLTGPPERGF